MLDINIKTLKEHKALSIGVIMILFSMPLRYYFPPMAYIVELTTIYVLIYYQSKGQRFLPSKSNEVLSIIGVVLVLLFGILIGDMDEVFFKESYRFSFFFIMLFVFKKLPCNFKSLLEIILLCCQFHFFFSIYELLYLNIISHGNFDGVLFTGRAMLEMGDDSDYLKDQIFAGMIFIRPFGLMFQPQKSSFIFVIGTIVKYLLNKNVEKPSSLWYILFFLIAFFTGAKTAIMTDLLILIIIMIPKSKRNRRILFGVVIMVGVSFLIYKIYSALAFSSDNRLLNDVTYSIIGADFDNFFNLPFLEIMFGMGIPSEVSLRQYGFSSESFLSRMLIQGGLIGMSIMILAYKNLCLSENRKTNFIFIIFMIGALSHYCVINSYFITFATVAFTCYAQHMVREKR